MFVGASGKRRLPVGFRRTGGQPDNPGAAHEFVAAEGAASMETTAPRH